VAKKKRKLRRSIDELIIDGSQVYKVARVAGLGGMAQMYEVLNLATKARFAMKEPHPEFVHRTDLFEPEARVLSLLDHPGIVKGISLGRSDDGIPYFLMQLLEGVTLRDAIRASGMLPLYDVCWIGSQSCFAVDYAHGANVVHRDIKPENIFLNDEPGTLPVVKILDFGVVKLVNVNVQPGRFAGTPRYASPQQLEGEPDIGPESDVYSLNVVIFEMATGETPFRRYGLGSSYEDMLRAIELEPPLLREYGTFPRRLEDLLRCGLDKNINNRPKLGEEAECLREMFKALPAPDEVMSTREIVAMRIAKQERITERVFEQPTIPDASLPLRMKEIAGPPSSDDEDDGDEHGDVSEDVPRPEVDRDAKTRTAPDVAGSPLGPDAHGPNGTPVIALPAPEPPAATPSPVVAHADSPEHAPTGTLVSPVDAPALAPVLGKTGTVRIVDVPSFDPKRTQPMACPVPQPPMPSELAAQAPQVAPRRSQPVRPSKREPAMMPVSYAIGVLVVILMIFVGFVFLLLRSSARSASTASPPAASAAPVMLAPAPPMAQATPGVTVLPVPTLETSPASSAPSASSASTAVVPPRPARPVVRAPRPRSSQPSPSASPPQKNDTL